MISTSPPTAPRTASTTSTSCRQSAWWKRSFTARTPGRAARRRAPRAPPARPPRPRTYASSRSERPPSSRHSGWPTSRPTRSDRDLDRPRPPPWKSTVSQDLAHRLGPHRVHADEQPLEQRDVGQRVAARVARDAVLGAHDHERLLDRRARRRVPRRPERRIEVPRVAAHLDPRDRAHDRVGRDRRRDDRAGAHAATPSSSITIRPGLPPRRRPNASPTASSGIRAVISRSSGRRPRAYRRAARGSRARAAPSRRSSRGPGARGAGSRAPAA